MARSIAVLGAGESGVGAALLAKKMGYEVFVSDFGKISDHFKNELIEYKIPFEEKGHSFEKIDKADLIVKSPGIPERTEVMRYFRLRHKKIISEIEFAAEFYKGSIIGITGSNGKTTTTKLCYHILREAGLDIEMGGNIGISFARLLTMRLDYDWVVLELSSFQLEDIQDFEVDVSVVLNITPDHLDRYDYSFEKYALAKWQLPAHTKSSGLLILNEGDSTLQELFRKYPMETRTIWLSDDGGDAFVSKETDKEFEYNLKGDHNRFNASVGIVLARELGVSESAIQDALLSFKPVEHRMEFVGSLDGLDFINDSKATNIDSCRVALLSVEKPMVWIAGGTDKGNDYKSIERLVRAKVNYIICHTLDDSNLRNVFEDYNDRIVTLVDIKQAIRWAIDHLDNGIVLMSPACASFDLYKNYEHRGNSFKEAVLEIVNERS